MFVYDKSNVANEYTIYDKTGSNSGIDASFEIAKFVNTLELPSKNPFILRVGYEKSGVHYTIESYVLQVNMELPAQAQLELKQMYKASEVEDKRIGSIVKLRIEYRMQQTLKTNSLFYIEIPKDLEYYAAHGIAPGSAIVKSDDTQLLNDAIT